MTSTHGSPSSRLGSSFVVSQALSGDVVAHREQCELNAVGGAGAFHQSGDMRLHGGDADRDAVGDISVGQSFTKEGEDVAFPGV